ncbi:hypothetical protein ACO0RG_003092 [Hanseniaspora osmophila]|mgnify:CR=1 FL=1|uniref:Autophagy-related protein 3 n=1 Tax=Hanseniaspora osmophila TaxID=56408 RepID=A0A1E5RFC1_9ASCO|nr:Autophagy-related protein 3 [Hanseniaspora osmophila]
MLRSTISSWREYLTPLQHHSKYKENGTITPEEFVIAGDYLQSMFPTWKWNGEDMANTNVKDMSIRDFLPKEKQFLVTRKVVCDKRVEVPLEDYDVNDEEQDGKNIKAKSTGSDDELDDEGWVVESLKTLHVSDRTNPEKAKQGNTAFADQANTLGADDEEFVEEIFEEDFEGTIDDFDESNGVEGFESVSATALNATTRYYDLYITYSTSYRVPKMYLVGFDSDGLPLQPKAMMDDITPDYRSKTATIENLPFFKSKMTSVSIHPCKHSNVMRMLMNKKLEGVSLQTHSDEAESREKEVDTKLAANSDLKEEELQDNEDAAGLRVDQYLVVFLKFISSVVPTIQYDFTMEGL